MAIIFTWFREKFVKDPEDPERLRKLQPTVYYTREDVLVYMNKIRGVAVDGLLLSEWEIVEENDLYFKVEVTCKDYLSTTTNDIMNWYFFKKEEES